ncbi:MAG: Uma2 family endonuclease [Stackebrandtia sp.]
MTMMIERPPSQQTPQYALGELIMSHSGPWTIEEFEALPPEVSVELHEGKLILTPSATFGHMRAGRRVGMKVDVYCGSDGNCVRKPDVLVLVDPEDGRPIPPDNLLLVGEIVSPGSKDEWGDKMADYADAGIPWYLIVQEVGEGFRAELHHLEEPGRYELVASAGPGEELRVPKPFDGSIDLSTLRRSRR